MAKGQSTHAPCNAFCHAEVMSVQLPFQSHSLIGHMAKGSDSSRGVAKSLKPSESWCQSPSLVGAPSYGLNGVFHFKVAVILLTPHNLQ